MEITSGQPAINVGGNGGFGFGGDAGIMFLAFLAMMGGFGGGWGRGPMGPMTGDQAAASSAQLQNSLNFNDLQDQNRDINNNVNNVYHDLASNLSDKYMELQRDVAANAVTLQQVQAKQAECCCSIKQEIAALNLENEKRFNALSSKMDQNEIQRLRDQVQDLKSDVRMQGVVRYPAGYSWNAGPGPFAAAPLPPVGFGM
ncbi:MAG: hypothetical protein IKQ22_03880 [Clostridia bacterium]|nr:hypothetical protein [Clostridia bacterium]